jgi:hypothetical protein
MRLAVALTVLGSALGLGGASPLDRLQPAQHGFGLQDALAFTEFPLFDAGERVDGLPLTAVLRRDDTADFVSFVYGDCTAADDAGCPPPLEIQVWPACLRNLHLYDSANAEAPMPEPTTVRGVPSAFFEDGLRLELQASRSTIVVFGNSRERVLRAAGALREVGTPAPGTRLPAPVPGAVDGALSC